MNPQLDQWRKQLLFGQQPGIVKLASKDGGGLGLSDILKWGLGLGAGGLGLYAAYKNRDSLPEWLQPLFHGETYSNLYDKAKGAGSDAWELIKQKLNDWTAPAQETPTLSNGTPLAPQPSIFKE